MAGRLPPPALVAEIVRTNSGLDKHALIKLVHRGGFPSLTTSELNSVLYKTPGIEWRPGLYSQRLWYPKAPRPSRPSSGGRRGGSGPAHRPAARLTGLYPWQMRALDAWEASGRRGVVEAVTGAGKTRVALAACADVLRAGGTCAIVVPTKELMRQWESEVRRHVIRAARLDPRVGFMGGGHHSTLSKSDIVICTAQSGSAYFLEPRAPALIVADECHHYGADTWSAVLEDGFDRRLGLTATYEREDNGVRDLLDPYFDGVCYSVDYTEALADGVIAPFKLAFVGARFRPGEAEAYDEAASKAGRYRAKLINEWGLPAEPFGAFMKAVNRLRHASEPEGSRLAGFYLSAFTKRRAIMAEASAKLDRVVELAPAIKRAERTIAFAQTKSAAARVVALLGRVGVDGAVLTSDLDMDDRSGIFAGFEDGTHELVAAPKLLDEGIDVPAADLAFIVATSRSRRQLVQRMGRVVRVKKDARPARVVILYVENTAEDPETGAHEDFLEIVEDAAEDVRTFDADSLAADINHYLNTW